VRRLHPDPGPVDLAQAYSWPIGPWVRGVMVASVDGATTGPENLSGSISGPADKAVFAHVRRTADVILVGAGTARAEGYRPAKRPIAVVSASLDLDSGSPLFADADEQTIVVTAQDADPDRMIEMTAVADVIVAGTDRVEPQALIDSLAERGLTHVACEGGPSLLADLATGNVLDELCLTISPVLVGGRSRRVLDGAELLPPRQLSLHALFQEDDMLFAQYRRKS
jgi:riboflavin biosynthesis pyrimidine reductase